MTNPSQGSSALKRPVHESTRKEYHRILLRTEAKVLKEGRLPGQDIINPRTRSVERSAWRWFFTRLLAGSRGDEEMRAVAVSVLLKMQIVADDAQQQYRARVQRGIRYTTTTRRNTKRRSLVGLPNNWREQMCSLVRDKYPDALSTLQVLSITGARPTELAHGVDIVLNGGFAYFKIYGAKKGQWAHGNDAGHDSRLITFDDALPALANFSFEAGMNTITKTRLDYVIRAASAALWPKRKGQKVLSAYSFRHAIAADLKASGLSPYDIAAFLGHRSEDSQLFYGSRAAGTAGGTIDFLESVEASSPIRKSKRIAKKLPQRAKQATQPPQTLDPSLGNDSGNYVS
jgi:integrase